MLKTKLAKNGMITLPVEIRKQFGIKIGDDIGFIELNGEYKIFPIKSMDQLIDTSQYQSTKKLIEEMRIDRENDK